MTNAGDRKQTEATIPIDAAGETVELDMHGATLLSVAIRGDAAADYVLDVQLDRQSDWIQDHIDTTLTGAADYDTTVETGMPNVRVRVTSGTGTGGDEATITMSAGGG
jgi:hypothetical protein